MNVHKYLQRKLYDIFTSKNGVLTLAFSIALVVSSGFFFGEVSAVLKEPLLDSVWLESC